ncbi:hypothetical protein EDB19DRAFT_1907424 [Suillus lakei]|nr:hypothetical protein EDB19DRAFT_1907424 [Suillus lakei]
MVAPIVNTGIQTAKYCNVAGLGVLIFDYFLTLEPEVRWTWNRRWNVTRVLFVISRYMAFAAAGMTSYAAIATRADEDCSHFDKASNAIHIISIVAAEGLLIIRTYAFWKQSKKLLAILLVLAAISIACAVSITQVVNNLTAAPVDPSAPPSSNCTFKTSRNSAIQYGFLVAYELLLMSLMVFKRYQDYRDYDSRLFDMSRVEALLPVVSVVNIVITYTVPISYDEMMDVPQLVLHSMLASRILFSLHEHDQQQTELATLLLTTISPEYNPGHTSLGLD